MAQSGHKPLSKFGVWVSNSAKVALWEEAAIFKMTPFGSSGAGRPVRYVVERDREVWYLMAVDLDGHKYLICAYEKQEMAEEAQRHLQARQDRL